MENWIFVVVASIIGVFVGASIAAPSKTHKYIRKCLNCKYYIVKGPMTHGLMMGMCQHESSFKDMPMHSDCYCGKFEYTEELKGEIIRDGLNEEYKTGKLKVNRMNIGEQQHEQSNIKDDNQGSDKQSNNNSSEDGDNNKGN